MIKHNFNQTPILLENFDQVIRSSEIRSSDPLSAKSVEQLRVEQSQFEQFTPTQADIFQQK